MRALSDLVAAAATWGLRRLPPERAHALAMAGLELGLAPRAREGGASALRTQLAGLRLANPIGLAAGFDKDARAVDALLRLGFGFVEAGTVTPRPQAGNPRPRLFRLAEDAALINRMGFNNAGLEAFVRRLARRNAAGVVGANLGANKDSPDRIGDYVLGLTRVWALASYLTVNISSPNTPGLRGLQERGALEELLGRLGEARAAAAAHGERPVFLKVAPDLDDQAVGDIAELAAAHRIDALIVANTSLQRPASLRGRRRGEAGGLSGRPLAQRSTELTRAFAQALGGRAAVVGVGGIGGARDVLDKLEAGASAVQLYSAFVYAGPGLIPRLLHDLSALMRAEGYSTVADATGARLRG